jgi:3,4-dihydroxy-2-butanone 4-phosphate synthase
MIKIKAHNNVSYVLAGKVLNIKVCATHQHFLGLIRITTQSATTHTLNVKLIKQKTKYYVKTRYQVGLNTNKISKK